MSEIVKSIPLRKPITKHGANGAEVIDKLDLKLPRGQLVLEVGEPFTTKVESDGNGGARVEFKVVPALAKQYLVDMSGINADLLGHMHPLDVRDAFDALRDIMRPTEG